MHYVYRYPGNVVFTDVPPNRDTDAVQLEQYSSYKPVTPAPTQPAPVARRTRVEDPFEEAEVETAYEAINILSPKHDEGLRENAGMVSISISVMPQLDSSAGHRVQVLLDGTVMAEGGMQEFVLENVDRGTHQLTAQITNANGDVLAQSAPSTFHLQRYSILMARESKDEK